jgi:phosphoglycolate phosphatase-like HAD superfamily hydrolase
MTSESGSSEPVPLYVDLDGTLVAADTLLVNTLALLRGHPWWAPFLPLVVLRGRAAFKDWLSRRAAVDPATLPYRHDVVRFLDEEKRAGRTIVLATAAHHRIANPVARHVGLFDAVIASDRSHNYKGHAKLEAIRRHAQGAFDYVGDSAADLPILQAAERAYLVHPAARLLAVARKTCRIERVFKDDRNANPDANKGRDSTRF